VSRRHCVGKHQDQKALARDREVRGGSDQSLLFGGSLCLILRDKSRRDTAMRWRAPSLDKAHVCLEHVVRGLVKNCRAGLC
jgi:hypothetical protein